MALSLSFSLSFLLDLTGSIFAQASDQTRLTTFFPILLRAFHSTRFELNATRPRLRSAISSFSSPFSPDLTFHADVVVVSGDGIKFNISVYKYEEKERYSNFRNWNSVTMGFLIHNVYIYFRVTFKDSSQNYFISCKDIRETSRLSSAYINANGINSRQPRFVENTIVWYPYLVI